MALGSVASVRAACASVSRRLQLALGRDHLGPALALRLGLPRHRALHLVGQIDVLDLDRGDLDAPGVGALVDDLLEHAR